MIPIIHFCWQEFTPVKIANVSVGDLYEQAQQRAPELFVFHDPEHRSSALVIPDLVTQTVEKLDLPLGEPAATIGLLDLLRQDQMTVHLNQPV